MADREPRYVAFAKTTRPAIGAVAPRERLFGLLDDARRAGVAWISGPPGSGKTTLAASYFDASAVRCLWYQLDEGDADVATFFYYLGHAARAFQAPGAEPLPLLGPEYHAGVPVFARRYFQSLYARLEPPFAVVFDNYQDVPASSGLHEIMRVALGELPPGGCAVVLSRAGPPPALARLRANRALHAIGWEELRLTREETLRIAALRRPQLDDAALDELYAKTQGWAAGLMLLLAQAGRGTLGDPLDLSTGQPVFDYLAGEIFQSLDEPAREFLLRSAYLPQMTAAMARELTGDGRAAELLAGLHRGHYFVSLRQAQPAPLYEYHPMLREFLLARSQETHAKEVRRRLQRKAGRLMEAAGLAGEAIVLYRESRDWEEMARLIEAQAESMLAQGRGETLRQWIDELPPELLGRRPWAVYWAAATQAQIAPRQARLIYERAVEMFRARGAEGMSGMVLACSGAMDAILYELDDLSLLDRWIGLLDAAASDGVRFPSAAVEARVACSMVFSLTLRQPQRRDIEAWIGRALGAARSVAEPNLQIFVSLLCALTLMWTGLYARAAELIEAARRLSRGPGVSPFSLVTLKNVESMHCMLTAQYQPGIEAMRAGLEIARTTGIQTWTPQLLVHGYGVALGAADLDTAARLAEELRARAAGAGRLNLCFQHHFQAWEAMLRKDLMRALQEEKSALRMAVEAGCPYFEALCRLALAQVLLECGDQRKCVAQLQRTRALAREIPNRHLEFACLLGFADMALAHGRQRVGEKALRLGLELGRQYGYRHFLWWWPASMARVCAKALALDIEPDYVRSLIRERGIPPEADAGEAWPWTFRVRALGNFRLQRQGEPLDGGAGKTQRKPLELLKVLVAHGGELVSEGRIIDALWPRIDGDSAHRSFTSALHRLRKLLGEDRAVILRDGKVTLDRRYFWVDVWAFDALAALAEAKAEPAAVQALAERMLALYRGPFLADDVDAGWCLPARERLRNRLARIVGRVLRACQEAGEAQPVRLLVDRVAESDPLAAERAALRNP